MSTEKEKVSKFLLAINDYAEEQRQKILNEIQAHIGKELEKAEEEALYDAYKLIQKETGDMRGAIQRDLSRKEMEAKKRLLNHRQAIVEKVFAETREKLLAFTATAEYAAMMEAAAKRLAAVFPRGEAVLYIRPQDEAMVPALQKAFGRACEVKPSPRVALGGILGEDPAMSLVADETLDSRLEAQQEWFAENSGLGIA